MYNATYGQRSLCSTVQSTLHTRFCFQHKNIPFLPYLDLCTVYIYALDHYFWQILDNEAMLQVGKLRLCRHLWSAAVSLFVSCGRVAICELRPCRHLWTAAVSPFVRGSYFAICERRLCHHLWAAAIVGCAGDIEYLFILQFTVYFWRNFTMGLQYLLLIRYV
jgi:hypothetical protein